MTSWVSGLIGLAAGVIVMALVAYVVSVRLRIREKILRDERESLSKSLAEVRQDLSQRSEELVNAQTNCHILNERLEQERKVSTEKLAVLKEASDRFQTVFDALSAKALRSNNESFLKLANETLSRFHSEAQGELQKRQTAIEGLTKPIRERLEKFDVKLDQLENVRQGAYKALSQQVADLLQIHLPQLHRETADLVKALRQPQARGRWGEVQLRRVVEMAGMLAHCDFEEQVSQSTEGGSLRPDLIVHLPGNRQVVVDAKAPVDAYLQAVESKDEMARTAALVRHAKQVRAHITQLSRKSYFEQFEPSPEFVVLFVPGEAFFSAALAQDPSLIEFGAENRVIPSSPTTLIALLKAVAYGWRQEAMAENAVEVAALGKALYERISTLADHWNELGQRLNKAVEAYNNSVGTLERRVLPSARKFRDLRAVSGEKEIAGLSPITQETRALNAREMLTGSEGSHDKEPASTTSAGEDDAITIHQKGQQPE